ncbi:hypothetical protein L2E82_44934 [Cichorium intybus]|uniref:Uncharacterized protein n=1 Tax=Cichorium intybus TaxID=13427 RepID=A0ACB8ZSX2_CICIN|nr:hypothetical protein L2E82_44934 [Cichorium intybus]
MLISGKIDPNFIPELPKEIFRQIKPGDAWGNVWRLRSKPVNAFLIPNSSSLELEWFSYLWITRDGLRSIFEYKSRVYARVLELREGEYLLMRLAKENDEKVSVAVKGKACDKERRTSLEPVL